MSEQKQFEEMVRENVPLAPMTTIGIGGPARNFAEVTTTEALAAGAKWARARGEALFVLGGGSNIIVADRGFDGLVLRVSIRGFEHGVNADDVTLTAGGGEEWDPLVGYCVERGWAGFECLSGIPGRVGATPIQNVGAYGQETRDTMVSLEAFDLIEDNVVSISAEECEFGYRTSRFKTRDHGRFVITRVKYRLLPDGQPTIRYPELEKFLDANYSGARTVSSVRAAVLALRRRKAMVIDPLDIDSRSVGSFFVNPTMSVQEFETIKSRAGTASDIPAFPVGENEIKLSAGWLIERSGIERGYVLGKVGISTKHALAIVNRGDGSAAEVIKLKELIQQRVLDTFGIRLKPEPVFVGFDEDPEA
jgi:UDP-N-acetylmuramate dehydrogenase